MASVLFDESDFGADFGEEKGSAEEDAAELCPRSECTAARDDLERLNSAAPTTIR